VIETLRLDDRAAGAALLIGHAVVVAILYRDPATGIRQATRGIPAVVYFLLLPAGGMVSGGYALLGGSHSSVFVFVSGSYLGVVGIALALEGVASAPIALAGVGVFVLSVVAIVASVRSFVAFLGLDLDM
jgi:hypothetical protein